MSWIRSFGPTWLTGTQNTTRPDRRSQNTYEDRSLESRRHFSHQADDAARQPATPSNLQLPSRDDPQRQTQLHETHRIIAPFQREPLSCEPTTASRQHPLRLPAHSVGPAGDATAYTAHSVVAVRPVANRTPVPYTISYNSSSETVRLSSDHRVSNLVQQLPRADVHSTAQDPGTSTGRTDSNATLVSRLQHVDSRDPVPNATRAETLGETQKTSQPATATIAASERAPTTRTVIPSAAGWKGPPGIPPDGPTSDSEEDRMAESAFYRNGRFTRCTLPNGEKRADLVMEKLPLLIFNGDVRRYHEFRDGFLAIMAFQCHLGPRQLLQHLLNHLAGRPRAYAEGYGLSHESYWDVLDMLEAHFGDNVIIQNTLRQDFVDLPPPTEDPADLTRYLDEVVTVARRLKRSGIDVDEGSTFKSIVMGHLPLQLRLKLIQGYGCRGTKKVSCVLDGLRRYLSDIKEAVEHALILRIPCEPTKDPDTQCQHQPVHEDPGSIRILCEYHQQDTPQEYEDGSVTEPAETTANAVNNGSDESLRERRTCPLCGLLHMAANCFMFTTIQKRLRRVLKLKICLLCLREGHLASMCPRRTKNPCMSCGHGQHHRILCKDADDSSRRKALRSSSTRMRTTTGPSCDLARSDHKRHSRKKSVVRNVTSLATTATNALRSGAQRSSILGGASNLNNNRKKKTKNLGADSKGQAGTARPTTSSSDERKKQQTAKASGDSRLLHARPDEEGSSESSVGNGDKPTPEDPPDSTTLQADAVYCVSSNDEQTTLLECIKATAENPITGISREVLIFFDSGSTRSFVSTELALDLRLPLERPCSLRVNTFGSELPTTVEGFSTSVVLRSKHRRLPSLAFTTQDHIASSIRTALVETSDLPKLRRGELTPSPLQVTPDILIGQDLVSIFKRHSGPPLPSGLYVVNSLLGPMLGGSGKMLTTVPEAATSFNTPTMATVVHQPSNMAGMTPPSPLLPPDSHQTQSPAHSVGSCTAIASKPNFGHSVEADLDAPSNAADQDYSSLQVEEYESSRSTATASCRTDRHSVKDSAKGSRQLRKQTNPLDTTAPLPALPSAILATLPEELQTDPRVPEFRHQASDCSQQSNVQQNPALNNPRKTRLRRRSSSLDRPVLGCKNHEELRKCENMRPLLDKQRPAIDKRNHASLDNMDTVCSLTTAPEHAASRPFISKRSQSATRLQSASNGSHPDPKFPSTSERAHSVLKSQHRPKRQCMQLQGNKQQTDITTKEPRQAFEPPSSGQTYHKTTRSEIEHGDTPPSTAYGQSSRTPTGSNQHSTAKTRCATSHSQGHRRPCIARQGACATVTDRPPIPIIDGFVSKSYAAFLAIHQHPAPASPAVDEDLPPQYELIGFINHLGVPSSYLPPTKFQPIVPSESAPLALLTFEQLVQEDSILPWKHILGSTLGALPPYWEMVTTETCLHLHEETQGTTYRGMPVCGIGPTGFFLCADSTPREHDGQRQTLLRLGRIARNTGKCLVLIVYDEPTNGIDLHHEAIAALRDEARLPTDHPIHLVAYRASALQLLHWRESFPNVVFGLEHTQLTNILKALQTNDHKSELYTHARDLRTLFTYVPLKHLALHSGCPSLLPGGHPGHFQTPTIILRAAELFEQLTGTPKDVVIEQSASTLNTIYHLNLDLPSRATTACDGRDCFRSNTIDDLSARLHVAPGPARRADHFDQGTLAPSRSSALDTAHSVVPVQLSLPHEAPKATYRICAFCDDPHPSTECMTYHLVKQRLRRIQSSKRCFLCLEEGHASHKCPERTTSLCRHCNKGQHHPALCRRLQEDTVVAVPTSPSTAANPQNIVAPDAAHSVAMEAGPTRRDTADGTFPPAMNHFRRDDQPSAATKADTRVVPGSAKKLSAAALAPAQEPGSHPSKLPKHTTASPSGNLLQVHAPSAAERRRTDHLTSAKILSKQRTQKKSNSRQRTQKKSNFRPAHSVGHQTQDHTPHGEKTEHSSRDEKTQRRSMDHHQEQSVMSPIKPTQKADDQCELCAQRHRAERCTSFSTIEKRRQRAQYLWLCFNCLRHDHRTEACPSAPTSNCSICNSGTHHQALCAESCRQTFDLAEASSTPVVVPAEDRRQPPAMAQDRQARKRKNRKPKK